MLVDKNNEELRSNVWRVVVVVTTLLIIIIGGYFLVKMFSENPVVGTWKYGDTEVKLTLEEDGTGMIDFAQEEIPFTYERVVNEKKIVFAIEQGNLDTEEEEMVNVVEKLMMGSSTFSYTIADSIMILFDGDTQETYSFYAVQE